MRKTTMAQVVEFAGQLNVTLQNISEDESTHGLAEAYNRLAQAMNRAWANSPSSKALTDSHGPKARTSNGQRNSIG